MVSTEWSGSVGFERFTICGLLLNSIFACRILSAGRRALKCGERRFDSGNGVKQELEWRRRVEFFLRATGGDGGKRA